MSAGVTGARTPGAGPAGRDKRLFSTVSQEANEHL